MNLRAGVIGPGAGTVQPYVGVPVAQGEARFGFAFVGQGQVVVGVGIARGERDGLLIRGDRFVRPFQFIENVAKIEIGQHVSRIRFGGTAVEFFGSAKAAEVEIDGAQIDIGGREIRLDGEDLVVRGDGALLVAAFFGLNGGDKTLLDAACLNGAGRRSGEGPAVAG